MDLKSKKGYVLTIAIVFTIVLITASIGLYSSVRYSIIGTKRNETEYIKGYYATLAGLRYAALVLKDPVNNCYFTPEHNGEICVLDGTELGSNFFLDIDVDPQKLQIVIKEWDLGETGWNDGEYYITAKYLY